MQTGNGKLKINGSTAPAAGELYAGVATAPSSTTTTLNYNGVLKATNIVPVVSGSGTLTNVIYGKDSNGALKERGLTISTSAPTGGVDGDIWIVY